jgi:hypothetical protein
VTSDQRRRAGARCQGRYRSPLISAASASRRRSEPSIRTGTRTLSQLRAAASDTPRSAARAKNLWWLPSAAAGLSPAHASSSQRLATAEGSQKPKPARATLEFRRVPRSTAFERRTRSCEDHEEATRTRLRQSPPRPRLKSAPPAARIAGGCREPPWSPRTRPWSAAPGRTGAATVGLRGRSRHRRP